MIRCWFSSVAVLLLFHITNSHGQQESLKFTIDSTTMKGSPGFFQIARSTNGQWWFIDAAGKPFFYKGVCAINRAGTAGGRRAKPGPYAKTIDEKYNYQQQADTFVYQTFEKLKSWGFNALGAWTTEEFFDKGMPYTEILEFFKEGPYITMRGSGKPIPDIFAEEWQTAIDKKARALCAPKRNSRNLVGYFTDNEIGFGRAGDFGLDPGFENAGRFGFSLLRETLALDSESAASKEAWKFIYERYEDIRAFAEAWNIPLNDKPDIKALNENQYLIESAAYKKDAQDFSAYYAATYFELVYQAIKRYDPNHLILGCRFGSPPEESILHAMKPWVDVISQNNYRPSMYERIDYLYEVTGLPVLIGEFSWNTDLFKKVPLPGEPKEGFTQKQRMFTRGEKMLKRAVKHPSMVGYTWYRWVQPTSTNVKFTDGLVDYKDNPDIHPPVLKTINPQLEEWRLQTHVQDDKPKQQDVSLILRNVDGGKDQTFELLMINDQWSEPVHGWQSVGTILNENKQQQSAFIKFDVEYLTWQWKDKTIPGGEGSYEVRLQKNKNYWKGTYTGTYNGEEVTGTAKAYVFGGN